MRWLRCNSCQETVGVTEVLLGKHHEYIDPDLYVCLQCHQPTEGQLELNDGPRTETRPHDPSIARIPF